MTTATTADAVTIGPLYRAAFVVEDLRRQGVRGLRPAPWGATVWPDIHGLSGTDRSELASVLEILTGSYHELPPDWLMRRLGLAERNGYLETPVGSRGGEVSCWARWCRHHGLGCVWSRRGPELSRVCARTFSPGGLTRYERDELTAAVSGAAGPSRVGRSGAWVVCHNADVPRYAKRMHDALPF